LVPRTDEIDTTREYSGLENPEEETKDSESTLSDEQLLM